MSGLVPALSVNSLFGQLVALAIPISVPLVSLSLELQCVSLLSHDWMDLVGNSSFMGLRLGIGQSLLLGHFCFSVLRFCFPYVLVHFGFGLCLHLCPWFALPVSSLVHMFCFIYVSSTSQCLNL